MSFMPEEGPDVSFDDLHKAWRQLAYEDKRVAEAEATLDGYRAVYRYEAMTDHTKWINNKPPTSVYLEKVVPFMGNNNDDREHLIALLSEVLECKRIAVEAKGYLDVLHEKIRIWQTKSANMRKVLSVE